MQWLHIVAYFFGGAFFVNAIPHFTKGVSGSRFPTPSASPTAGRDLWAWAQVSGSRASKGLLTSAASHPASEEPMSMSARSEKCRYLPNRLVGFCIAVCPTNVLSFSYSGNAPLTVPLALKVIGS